MAAADGEHSGGKEPRIGVLAIQGSFREHISAFKRCGMEAVEVRKPEDLAGLSGLVIPGGESTTMAKVAERNHLFDACFRLFVGKLRHNRSPELGFYFAVGQIPALQTFKASQTPIWGTCAGLIFLADRALGQKIGGQALLGGLDCTVHRNFFGSQINSFETDLQVPPTLAAEGGAPTFRAVFIRAPAIVETGDNVEVLAEFEISPGSAPEAVGDTPATEVSKVAVAVRQGQLLATAFHPELTDDTRWHALFAKMVKDWHTNSEAGTAADLADTPSSGVLRPVNVPADLPIYNRGQVLCFKKP